jgi:hypothetical protein
VGRVTIGTGLRPPDHAVLGRAAVSRRVRVGRRLVLPSGPGLRSSDRDGLQLLPRPRLAEAAGGAAGTGR